MRQRTWRGKPIDLSRRDRWEARFWGYVDRSGDCWTWGGYRTPRGYGTFTIDETTVRYGHRISYALTFGDPGDLLVLHRCDNPPCCNPAHLFAGTALDNVQDMFRKGRDARPNSNATHCKNGHEFTPENTKVVTPHHSRNKSGTAIQWRACRACCRDRMRAKRAALRGVA